MSSYLYSWEKEKCDFVSVCFCFEKYYADMGILDLNSFSQKKKIWSGLSQNTFSSSRENTDSMYYISVFMDIFM